MVGRNPGGNGDRLADHFDRKFMAPGLGGDHAKQMQGIGVAGRDRQNLPVEAFGIGQTPFPMMADGFGEPPLNLVHEGGFPNAATRNSSKARIGSRSSIRMARDAVMRVLIISR